ncbi:MAG: YdcF family protein [Neisseriales bacterium]|nr:MAG: YdcF family protein [Neisseriales bacterium]
MITILLHRLLQSFLLPPLNSLVIILLGVFFFKPQKRIGKILILIGCISSYLQATPYFAYQLNRLLAPPVLDQRMFKDAQAIVILGGGINNNASEYSVNAVSNPDTFIRVRYAAYLAKKNPDLPIFASGGAIDTKDSEASLMKKALVDEFDVENQIYLEPDSKTTTENAKYTSKLLQQYSISKVILVTSASHMRRATALFEHNGINIIPAPTGFYSLGYTTLPLLWFIPTGLAMATTSSILHELLGYIYDVEIKS